MNSSFHNQSQAPTHHSSKPIKKRLTEDHLQILESSFNASHKLKSELKLELARKLGLSPRKVAVWYQNRRARHKVEIKEHEYTNIQQELDNVLAEKIKLENEVKMLRYELNKIQQEMLLLASTSSTLLSGSASDDDHPNSYSPGNTMFCCPETGNFPGEKLHSWFNDPVGMID